MFAVHLGLVASLIALFHAEDQPAIDELVKVLAPSVFVARTSDLIARSPQTFHYLLPAITKGSLSYLSSPCFSKNVLQSGVGIVH